MIDHPAGASVRSIVLLSSAAVALAGCALSPDPFTPAERWAQIQHDKELIFGNSAPIAGPITLEEAMARAVKFNLDHQAEMMNQAVSLRQIDLSSYDMLPKLVSSAGYSDRGNDAASSSESIRTHTQSLEPSISTERKMWSAQATLTWNILDFGVSYIRARQNADRALMADEQRRKVLHNIIQDVRTTYWRSVAAERLLDRIDPLLRKTQVALRDASTLEARSIRSPLGELQYQRNLLATLERLRALRRELVGAKIQLAALMNLKPGTEFHVVVPDEAAVANIPVLATPPEKLIDAALINRPELIQASYESRISNAETRRILLEMLPGISFTGGGNYDSNKYSVNHMWATYGFNIAWNLMTVFSTPARLDLAEADQKLKEVKHAALSMAVMAQVNVAYLRLQQATEEYVTAQQQASVERRIFQQMQNAGEATQVGDLAVIQEAAENVYAALRRDSAYANLQNAYGAMMVSIGADPLPDTIADNSLPTLVAEISNTLHHWGDGTALARVLTATNAAAVPAPAAIPDSADRPKPAEAPSIGGTTLIAREQPSVPGFGFKLDDTVLGRLMKTLSETVAPATPAEPVGAKAAGAWTS
ncbi:MAG: TolC family protein [Rhodospirillaceae bacterium]